MNIFEWLNSFPAKSRAFAIDCWVPPTLAKDPQYLDAKRWRDGFKPVNADYAPALEYASQRYRDRLAAIYSLDDKADSLFRFSSTIVGALATALKLAIVAPTFWLISACAAFFFVIAWVIQTRRPVLFDQPLESRKVIEHINWTEGEVRKQSIDDSHQLPTDAHFALQAFTAASYYRAEIGLESVSEWKSRQIKRATRLFLIGLLLLFIGAITNPEPVSKTSDTTPASAT